MTARGCLDAQHHQFAKDAAIGQATDEVEVSEVRVQERRLGESRRPGWPWIPQVKNRPKKGDREAVNFPSKSGRNHYSLTRRGAQKM